MKKKELIFILILIIVIIILLFIKTKRDNMAEIVVENNNAVATNLADESSLNEQTNDTIDSVEQITEVSEEGVEEIIGEDDIPIPEKIVSKDGSLEIIAVQKATQNINLQIHNISGKKLEEQNRDIIISNSDNEEIANFTIIVPQIEIDEVATVGIPFTEDFSNVEIK